MFAADPLLFDVDPAVVLIVIVKVVIVFVLLLVATMLMVWFERKVVGDLQNRIGPNLAGPWGIAAGAGLFGLAQALQLRSDDSVRALLLVAALALALTGLYSLYTRRIAAVATMAILTGAFLFAYIRTDEVPDEFTYMTPYITTLLVLIFASQRLRPPAAAGKPWRTAHQTPAR